MYATAIPRPGLIKPRSHTHGPNMNWFALGVFRPELASNGLSRVRFRPSEPKASFRAAVRSASGAAPAAVPAQGELWLCLGLVQRQLAGLGPRPRDVTVG